MKFHKGTFSIQKENIQGKRSLETVIGWIEETNSYGFDNRNGEWIATDLNSGVILTKGKTRKECVAWIEENLALIKLQKTKPRYRDHVSSFKKLKGGN